VIVPDNLTANASNILCAAGAWSAATASGTDASCGRANRLHHLCVRGRHHPPRCRRVRRNNRNRSDTVPKEASADQHPHVILCQRVTAPQQPPSSISATRPDHGAGAAQLRDSTRTSGRVSTRSDGSIRTVGITANEGDGRILAGGAEMSQFGEQASRPGLRRRLRRAGLQVAVQSKQPLTIDYDPRAPVDHTSRSSMSRI